MQELIEGVFLLFFPTLPPLTLEVGPLQPAEGLGCAVSSLSGVRVEPRPKTNLVHSRAVRKLDFKAIMYQNRFRLGLRPIPHSGSLQRSPGL